MTDYNAADLRKIRAAKKAAKQAEAERRGVILQLMSSSAGRSYVYDQLERCHVFSTSFALDPGTMAFAEGERNIGLQLLNDIMAFAPEQYIFMTREANDRRNATEHGLLRSDEDGNGGDSDPDSGDYDSSAEGGVDRPDVTH